MVERSHGVNILFDILARHGLRVRELPFPVGERLARGSTASWRPGARLACQMVRLRMGRMSRFAAVGALGTVVNLLVMAMLLRAQAVHYVAASLVAAEISMLFNFGMQERFVFRDLRGGSSWRRLGQHLLFNNVEAVARLPLLVLLVQRLSVPSVLAQALTLGIAFLLRFLFMSRVVYRPLDIHWRVALVGHLPARLRSTSARFGRMGEGWVPAAVCMVWTSVIITPSSALVQRLGVFALAIPLLVALRMNWSVRQARSFQHPFTDVHHSSRTEGWAVGRRGIPPSLWETAPSLLTVPAACTVLIALVSTDSGSLAGRAVHGVATLTPRVLNPSTGVFVIALLLTSVSAFTLYLSMDSKRTPEAWDAAAFPPALPPVHGFSIAVPARHEEAVLAQTLDRLLAQTHPRFEILTIVSRDDPVTAGIAIEYESRYPEKVTVVWDENPTEVKNKPRAMNASRAMCDPAFDFYFIVDAESDVAPDLLRHIDTVVQQRDADVVIGGVQLMDFYKSWWAPVNCVEYYMWFSSRLHHQARAGMTPYSGNSLAVRRALLDEHGWYDPACLAEDCDLGIRLSAAGAKTVVAYSPTLATKEETPKDIRAWLKQRVRWHQGFLQVLLKRDWMRLPTRRQRALALFTLGSTFTQAATGLALMVAVATVLWLEVPDWVALMTFLPLVPGILFIGLQVMGLHDLYHSFRPYYDDVCAAQECSNGQRRKVSGLRRRAVDARFLAAGLQLAIIRAAAKRGRSTNRHGSTPAHRAERGASWCERKAVRLEALREEVELRRSQWQLPRSRMARLTWRHYAAIVLSPLTYQPLLSVAGIVAVVRQRRGDLSWVKTEHRNAHRRDVPVASLVAARLLGQTT